MKRKVALYGAGNIAQKKYFILDDLFEIVCCYDNDENKWGRVIYNTPIKKWEKIQHMFIIITVGVWEEIAIQLENDGLELGKDFLPWYIFVDLDYSSLYYTRRNFLNGKYLNKEWDYASFFPDKKVAVIYGNCQTGIYRNALMLSREFKEDYVMINIPQIWEYNDSERIAFFLNDKSFWKIIKLFIYQFVSKTYAPFEELSSEYCVGKLSADCQKVSIVSLNFRGYFPQTEGPFIEGVFGYSDKYVDTLIQQKIEADEIIDLISSEQFIPEAEIESCVEKSLAGLRKRDGFADIKISDYIEKNYTEEQLFFMPLHPCNNLLKEYAKRIFKYLGLKWDITDEYFAAICSIGMRGADVAVYPSVAKKLGLKKYENRFYFNEEYVSRNMVLDFKQYMGIYIKHRIKSEKQQVSKENR